MFTLTLTLSLRERAGVRVKTDFFGEWI